MFPQLGAGLGLRAPHFSRAIAADCGVDWFEAITENAMVAGGNPRRVLRAVREHHPLVQHGVSLSIAGLDPLDDYLAPLAPLVRELEPAMGTPRFVALYAAGLLASDALTYVRHRDNPGYQSLGASGAISAVLFASIVYFPTSAI